MRKALAGLFDMLSRKLAITACISFGCILACACSRTNKDAQTVTTQAANALSLRLELLAGKNSFRWNEPIDVLVSLCNSGAEAVDIIPIMVPQEHCLELSVSSSEGQELPFMGPEFRINIPPQKPLFGAACMRELIHLDALYNFVDLDRYSVSAKYYNNVFDRNNSTTRLSSNVIPFDLDGPRPLGASSPSRFYGN